MKTVKEVVETTLVTPIEEMQRQELWLSNLDLRSPHIYTTVISYYSAEPEPGPEQLGGGVCFFDPERLRVALARALVPFYPLAGRLSCQHGGDDGEDSRRHVDCNGQGVLFVVARVDVTGAEIFHEDYQPSPEVTEMFVPDMPPEELPCMVALFQLTFLKCGGVVLSSSFHHAIGDGTSSIHFMRSWSRLARGLDVADAVGVGPQAPFHDRTALRARSPPVPPPDTDHSPNIAAAAPRAFVARVYPFPLKLIDDLKSRCGGSAAGGGDTNTSTFAAVSAHIWRCMCLARRLAPPDSDTHLGMIVNVRQRLRPPLPQGFSGNAALQTVATARVRDVIDGSPASVAGRIRDAINAVDDAYVRSVVDYHEVIMKTKKNKERFIVGAAAPPESDVAMLSWLGMPLYDADFGWGVPRLVMPTTVSIFSGMVLVLPRGHGKESGITVIVTLEPHYLPCFQKLLYDVVV